MSPRGFASMTPETRREAQSRGGKSTQSKVNANRFNTETAREAARKSLEAKKLKKLNQQGNETNL